LLVPKVRERLAVSRRMVKKLDVWRFNLKKLHEQEVKEWYQVTVRNKFAAVENFDDNGDISRAWDTIMSKFRPKRVSFFVSRSIKSHGMMRNV
jgi:hypothetical protein